MPHADEEVRKGVSKAFGVLRKTYANRERRRVEETAASNAARLRQALEQQAEVGARLPAPLQGLPSVAARGGGAAAWESPLAEAVARRRQLQRQLEAEREEGDAAAAEEQAREQGGVHSVRPVPAQRLQATKNVQNIVAGKGVPLQVGAWGSLRAAACYMQHVCPLFPACADCASTSTEKTACACIMLPCTPP
jgi:hypothetical protein